MSEIRLHPTSEQHAARVAALAPAIQRASADLSAARAVVAALAAEHAIVETTHEPLAPNGDAPRWLLLVVDERGSTIALGSWAKDLDAQLADETASRLLSLALEGDDDGRHPVVMLDGSVWRMLYEVREHQAPGMSLPMSRSATAVAEVWVLDRLSDPIGDVLLAYGGMIAPATRRRLEAMAEADDERRAPDYEGR